MAEAESPDISNAKLLVTRLRALGDALGSMSTTQSFNEVWGSPAPALDRRDLACVAYLTASKIEAVDWSGIDQSKDEMFASLATKAGVVAGFVPQIPNQGPQLIIAITTFLMVAESMVVSAISSDQMKGQLALPLELRKKSTLALARLDEAESNIATVTGKLQTIDRAYQAAENLPVTQKELEDALAEISETRKMVLRYEVEAKQHRDSALQEMELLQAIKNEAVEVQKKLHSAYSAATSQGLARAFDQKSRALGWSMGAWTVVLGIALAAASFIGWNRFPEVLSNLSGKPDWGIVSAHMGLSFLSLGPAIWLAWVATKQIGQRFRLAEDYGYKAALAKAYEGYKAEAENIDPLLQAQLFGTALGRLDEIPLRLIEADVPGSPWHELLQSKEFGQAVADVPGLKEKVSSILRRNREAPATATSKEGGESA